MDAPEMRNPRGGVGRVEGSGEQPTPESYPHTLTDAQWETAVLAVVNIAGGNTERGERARRAVHDLCGGPFVSRAVWAAAESVAWTFVAAILTSDAGTRTRANAIVRDAMSLAAESRATLGRAA